MSLAIAGSNEARPGEESVINHVDKNTDATDLKPVGLNLNHVSHGTNRPHDLSDNAKKKLPITITTPIKGDIISRYFHLYEKNMEYLFRNLPNKFLSGNFCYKKQLIIMKNVMNWWTDEHTEEKTQTWYVFIFYGMIALDVFLKKDIIILIPSKELSR